MFYGEQGNDFEVGDAYAPLGNAIGGGDDTINSGPGTDVLVGDSYTKSGVAKGSGRDHLHGVFGNDMLYGDNYAASPDGSTSGGARYELAGAPGANKLLGGPGHDL